MKFSKYHQPAKNRKPKARLHNYSPEYIEARRDELFELLSTAKTESQKRMLIDAYHISINP